MKLKPSLVLAAVLALSGAAQAATELVVATVNNGHMIEMQKLTKNFEAANPDIKVKWVTLEEGVLRQRVTTDIATKGGQFDVMTIGMYETPIWGKKGWLQELKTDAAYDADDILPAMRNGLSVDGKMFAAPFYGESSMLMYRKDLADKAGVQVPDRPTWTQIKDLAAKIHDPKNGVYGICLRGKPGWGDNMAFLTTLVNTNGGQ
jgi:sorbitol/mannitol transport system substrate-binding protein